MNFYAVLESDEEDEKPQVVAPAAKAGILCSFIYFIVMTSLFTNFILFLY
jgi:hypothetical protein